jgi:BirA family transcriptional regulator, biotin operon repressor / biotin---[acetyl-CoA-carboxylase] ligase
MECLRSISLIASLIIFGIHFYKDSEGTFNAGIVEVEADGHLVLQDETGKIRRYLFKEVQYIL